MKNCQSVPLSETGWEVGSGLLRDTGQRSAWTSQAFSMNAPCHLQLCKLSRFCPIVATGHNKVAFPQTERGGHCVTFSPCRRATTTRPFCCHAKTAALTGTVPLFTYQPQTHTHPGTNTSAAFSFLLLMSMLPLKDKTHVIFDKINFASSNLGIQSVSWWLKGKECRSRAPLGLITEKRSLHV